MAWASWDTILGSGKVTNTYGKNNSRYASGSHTGVDLVLNNQSKTVQSYTSGTVEQVVTGQNGSKKGYGNYVVVKDDKNNYILYGHLDSVNPNIQKGSRVSVGNPLGIMGSTGNSTGPHLHLEVRQGINKQSASVNPAMYFMNAKNSSDDTVSWADSAATVGPTGEEIVNWFQTDGALLLLRIMLVLVGLFLLLATIKSSLLG